MDQEPAQSGYLRALPGQLIRAGIYLGIIAALHYLGYLKLSPVLRWTLVGVIVVSALVPLRFSAWASGVGFLVVGGVAYFVYGSALMGIVCGGLGLISLYEAIGSTRRAA